MQWFVRRFLRQRMNISSLRTVHTYCDSSIVYHEADSCGIPAQPTWSVNTLLSSYPTPTISSATLSRLHELSALIPPGDGTQGHIILKQEIEDLVRLVEAVRLVDTKDVNLKSPRDNSNGNKQHCNQQRLESAERDETGWNLLKHASRTLDGFYVVDADRKR